MVFVSPTGGLRQLERQRIFTALLCLVSEPLKHAVARFRSAATHLDRVILSSDLVKET